MTTIKNVKINKLEGCKVIVNVKLTKQFHFRLRIATLMIKIAAQILGCNKDKIEIKFDQEK